MFRLDGKTALVTGASGGIGAAIARTLHAQGAAVALSGTRREALEALAAELGERAHVCPADLRDPAAPEALVAAAEAAAGPLAILVNNAGFTRDMLALRMKDEDWQAVLDVDLTGAVPAGAVGAEGHAAPARRADRVDFLHRRQHRQCGAGELRRRQGGTGRHDQGAGAGSGLARHYGERGGAGLRGDADDRRAVGRARRPSCPRRSRSAGSVSRRTLRRRWPILPATRRAG